MEPFAELLSRVSRKSAKHYDSKCGDLANHFIDDHPDLRPKADDLAIEIQEAIDTWIAEQEQLNAIDAQVQAITD